MKASSLGEKSSASGALLLERDGLPPVRACGKGVRAGLRVLMPRQVGSKSSPYY
jgi:hypothetical protein